MLFFIPSHISFYSSHHCQLWTSAQIIWDVIQYRITHFYIWLSGLVSLVYNLLKVSTVFELRDKRILLLWIFCNFPIYSQLQIIQTTYSSLLSHHPERPTWLLCASPRKQTSHVLKSLTKTIQSQISLDLCMLPCHVAYPDDLFA